jgi:hypothetical protein
MLGWGQEATKKLEQDTSPNSLIDVSAYRIPRLHTVLATSPWSAYKQSIAGRADAPLFVDSSTEHLIGKNALYATPPRELRFRSQPDIFSYTLWSILIVTDLVQSYTKLATSNIYWRMYNISHAIELQWEIFCEVPRINHALRRFRLQWIWYSQTGVF